MENGFEISKSNEPKVIIEVPEDGKYIDILGYRLEKNVGSFEGFLEYLNGLERTQSNWESLKSYLGEYKERKIRETYGVIIDQKISRESYGRHCIALSIDDILEKMDEIEGKI